ncbi:thermonuclease family protein [Sorangium sp. So ce1000]|uniref:thermonuclease family protein n=1 Tax=Sorangium sp. So ce1000 TaxID=3133325 RepID=UPI003F5E9B11
MTSTLIRGQFLILGKEPDGDSIRFVPDDASSFEELYRYHRMRFNQNDGSIQLRLEGIDTPETHYGPKYAQPLGDTARNALLEALGYDLQKIDWSGEKVVADRNEAVRGAIITDGADANGRPISYVFREDAPFLDALNDGAELSPSAKISEQSANYAMVTSGHAYLTLYTSMPKRLRRHFRAAATQARKAGKGVWAADSTEQFWLSDLADVTAPDGALILPKLFRRSVDYIKSGFDGTLEEWLQARNSGPRPENDRVLLESAGFETSLSEIVETINGYVRLKHDFLDVVFVEK